MYSLPRTHPVVSGETIGSIALKYGITQNRLREMNNLDNSHIMIGQKLAVIDSKHASDTVINYVVNIGDTLSEIAERFSVKINRITNATGKPVSGNIIHPGDALNIVVSMAEPG